MAHRTKGGGGDEPPIRVKGGSLDLQLLTKNHEWQKNGDDMHWHISGGRRATDVLNVVLALCNGRPIGVTGNTLEILHSDGVHLLIKSVSLKTQLTRVDDDTNKEHLKKDSQHKHWLRYEPQGEITQVMVDSNTVWTSGGATSLCELLVLDCG